MESKSPAKNHAPFYAIGLIVIVVGLLVFIVHRHHKSQSAHKALMPTTQQLVALTPSGYSIPCAMGRIDRNTSY